MSQHFKTKFLQHSYCHKCSNHEAGFTLIELLIVLIIISILTAIALPSFLNQANKARQSEGIQQVGAINRAQEVLYLERRRFTSDVATLGLGIQTQTSNYQYEIKALDGGQPSDIGHPSYREAIVTWADPINSSSLRSYLGVVDVVKLDGNLTTTTIVCGKTSPGAGTTDAYNADSSTSDVRPVCQESQGFEALE